MTRTCQVIDVSHWNNVTDWHAVKGSGVVAVILKATEDTTYVDPAFKGYAEGALSAGLKLGAYHFLRPGSDDEIGDQMALFAEVTKPWNITRLAIDYEAEGLTLTHLKQALSNLSKRRAEARICIYGGSLLKAQLGDSTDADLSQYPLWLAHYNANPTWPKGVWPQWSLWQFNDGSNGPGPKQEIAGIQTGVIDHNVFDGSDAACSAWFEPETVTNDAIDDAPIVVKVLVSRNIAVDVEYDVVFDKSGEYVEVHCPPGVIGWIVHEP
jgi:lysozyme